MSLVTPHRPLPVDPGRWAVPMALAMALAVTIALAVDGHAAKPEATRRSQEFQRLVGGLGTAPATNLSAGPHSLDVRLGRTPFEHDGTTRAAATWVTRGATRFD